MTETQPEPVEPPNTRPMFKVESFDYLRKVIISAQGGDPDAQQTLNAFLKFNNNIERTNLPSRRDVITVAYLDGCGKLYYPSEKTIRFPCWPIASVVAFMAKGGDKSKQFVELMKQTPNLADLQTMGTPPQHGLMDRFLHRGKEPEKIMPDSRSKYEFYKEASLSQQLAHRHPEYSEYAGADTRISLTLSAIQCSLETWND